MSDIPSEVFREILLRLPAESLLRFKIVCKTWLHMIEDPSFIKAHTNNHLYSHTLLVRNETGAPLYTFSLDSLKFIEGSQKIEAIRIKQLIRPGVPRLPDLCVFPVASCNGVVLLSNENVKKIWAIWNPLTGECHELPKPDSFLSLKLDGVGLGYDCDADDYKVVRIDRLSSSENAVIQTRVYSLKSGLWSMIESCPPQFYFLFGPGVFLDGTLYWKSSHGIIAFDLTTESYFQLPEPSQADRSRNRGLDTHDSHLVAMDGCLVYSTCYRYNFDGWVMKDNGVEKFWTKLFSITNSLLVMPWRSNLVAYLKRERQIVVQHDRWFLWFDIDDNSVLRFSIHGFPGINSSQICSGSLVRLNARDSTIRLEAVAAGKTSTRKRKRKAKKTDPLRLKFCVRDVDDECANCLFEEDELFETSSDDDW